MTAEGISMRKGFGAFAFIGVMVLLLALLMRAETHLFGWFGPHEYWASQWATDYSNGFINRGMLGEILRVLSIDSRDYLILTVVSWFVSAAVYLFVLDALWRLLRDRKFSLRASLAIGVLLSPAISGMLIETTGDPLQFLLLINLLLARFLIERPAPVVVTGAAYAVLGATMVLVHEAAIFIFVPWLAVQAFLIRRTPQAKVAFITAAATGVLVAGFVVLHGFGAGGNQSPVLHLGAQQFVYEGRLSPPFSVQLSEETHRMFGSGFGGYVQTVLRLLGATLVPCLAALLLVAARIGDAPKAVRLWRLHLLVFVILALCLAPLMVIAHDWGRFVSYTLILFISAMTGFPAVADEERHELPLRFPVAGMLVLSGFTDTLLINEYRMDGLYASAHVLLVAVLIVGLFGVLTFWDRRETIADRQDAPQS